MTTEPVREPTPVESGEILLHLRKTLYLVRLTGLIIRKRHSFL